MLMMRIQDVEKRTTTMMMMVGMKELALETATTMMQMNVVPSLWNYEDLVPKCVGNQENQCIWNHARGH